MRKVLVTGASGFIGGQLVQALKKEGFRVLVSLRTPADGAWDQSLIIDHAKDEFPDDVIHGVEIVFHLAGKAHALVEIAQDEEEYFQVNTEGTRRVLDAARKAGVQTFVYFSSVKAAGDTDGLMDETVTREPDTPYGRSKREAEKLVLEGGFVPYPVVIRPSMVYGQTTKGNLPKMIRAVQRGRFPPLPQFGNKRSMVHVGDVVQAAMLVAGKREAAGQIYIITDGEIYSTPQIYEWICECLNKPVPSWHVPLVVLKILAKIGDGVGRMRGRRFIFDTDALDKLAGSAWYSSEKIERELGFRAKRNLRTALPEIVAYLESGSP